MSTIMKGMILRAAPEIHTPHPGLLRGKKLADQVEFYRENRSALRRSRAVRVARVTRCQSSDANSYGFANPKKDKSEPSVPGATLSPVSDPVSTTKKVRCLKICTFHSSFL